MSNIESFPNGGEDFKPVFDMETMGKVEKTFQTESGVNRRILLIMLTKNRGELEKAFREVPGAVLEAYACGVNYTQRLRDFCDMMECSCVRMTMCLRDNEYVMSEEEVDLAVEMTEQVLGWHTS